MGGSGRPGQTTGGGYCAVWFLCLALLPLAALISCSSPYAVPVGEAAEVDYQMAGLLADAQTRSGALARNGLADGYLSAAEANGMWTAYRAEREARAAEQKVEVIKRWSAQGTEARRAGTGNTGSVHDGPVPQGCAQTLSGSTNDTDT